PTALTLPAGRDAAVRPVSRGRWASTGPGDPNEAYWLDLYRICGIPARPMVRTAVEGVPVRAYFNSGLVAVRRVAGLFRQWEADFLRLVAREGRPRARMWRVCGHMVEVGRDRLTGTKCERVHTDRDRLGECATVVLSRTEY